VHAHWQQLQHRKVAKPASRKEGERQQMPNQCRKEEKEIRDEGEEAEKAKTRMQHPIYF